MLTGTGLIETLQELLLEEEQAMPIAFSTDMDGTYVLPRPMSRDMISYANYCDEHGRLVPDEMFSERDRDPDDPEDKPLNRANYIRLDQTFLYIELDEPTTIPTAG